jgi:hypothetical protein
MNYINKTGFSFLLNTNYYNMKSKGAKILLYFLLAGFLIGSVELKAVPKGNPCDCNQYPYTFEGLPANCDDKYIKNGCFECYELFSQYEGNEGLNYRKYEQFEFAIGGVDWGGILELRTGTDKFEEGYLKGWYSPTLYTPNFFNYFNPYPQFLVGQNHLNLRENYYYFNPRYPNGWVLDGVDPSENGSNNYGYVGFWTEPPPNTKSIHNFNISGISETKNRSPNCRGFLT